MGEAFGVPAGLGRKYLRMTTNECYNRVPDLRARIPGALQCTLDASQSVPVVENLLDATRKPEFDRKKKALLEEYKIPEALADYESKLRDAATNPGHHEDWDFAYGEVTHTVDNARKVLFLDPAKRSEVQQTALALLPVWLESPA